MATEATSLRFQCSKRNATTSYIASSILLMHLPTGARHCRSSHATQLQLRADVRKGKLAWDAATPLWAAQVLRMLIRDLHEVYRISIYRIGDRLRKEAHHD